MNDQMEMQADVEHEIWASWMRYMFSCGEIDPTTGNWIMPADKVERWHRQMNTIYADLSEHEKESDREQVCKHILAHTTGVVCRDGTLK